MTLLIQSYSKTDIRLTDFSLDKFSMHKNRPGLKFHPTSPNPTSSNLTISDSPRSFN